MKGFKKIKYVLAIGFLIQLCACGAVSERLSEQLGDKVEASLLDMGIDAVAMAESVHDSVAEMSLDDLDFSSNRRADSQRYLLLSSVELGSETDVELLMGTRNIRKF